MKCVYLKSWEFLQRFKNRAGDKLKLPKWEPPAGIGRVDISDLFFLFDIFYYLLANFVLFEKPMVILVGFTEKL